MRTFSRVSLPLWTILSAISTAGIRPENVALVYPYVTLAMNFSPSCRASRTLRRAYKSQTLVYVSEALVHTLSSLAPFIACLTITLVSNNSVNIRANSPLRTVSLTYIIPFGATTGRYEHSHGYDTEEPVTHHLCDRVRYPEDRQVGEDL